MDLFITILLVSFCSMGLYTTGHAHSYCFDRNMSLKNNQPLTLCPMYQQFGCCATSDEHQIQKIYDQLLKTIHPTPDGTCQDFIKEILCQICSPFSGHIFEIKVLDIKATDKFHIPGLCPAYCSNFSKTCPEAFKYILSKAAIYNISVDSDTCGKLTPGGLEYCYPDIVMPREEVAEKHTTDDDCICFQPFADNLHLPYSFKIVPDGSGKILIGQMAGEMFFLTKNGFRLKDHKVFMNIKKKISERGKTYASEFGYRAMAFHPNFTENGLFYVNYVTKIKDKNVGRLSQFKANDDLTTGDVKSECILITYEINWIYHFMGELLFGDDGYLYTCIGDASNQKDPYRRGQDMSVLHSKCIRIEVGKYGEANCSYGIPKDNPFVNMNGTRPEIWAVGLRSPWRLSFDKGDPITGKDRGRLFLGDVGYVTWEEINIIEKGMNYGWSIREGNNCVGWTRKLDPGEEQCPKKIKNERLPIYTYKHGWEGGCVIGGFVYRGQELKHLQGKYLYYDYRSKLLNKLTQKGKKWERSEVHLCTDKLCGHDHTSLKNSQVYSFGEDEEGEVYLLGTWTTDKSRMWKKSDPKVMDGRIYKLVKPIILS